MIKHIDDFRHRDIPRFQSPAEPPDGELVTIRKAAQILATGTAPPDGRQSTKRAALVGDTEKLALKRRQCA